MVSDVFKGNFFLSFFLSFSFLSYKEGYLHIYTTDELSTPTKKKFILAKLKIGPLTIHQSSTQSINYCFFSNRVPKQGTRLINMRYIEDSIDISLRTVLTIS
jgi:hypothetical protein